MDKKTNSWTAYSVVSIPCLDGLIFTISTNIKKLSRVIKQLWAIRMS